MEITINIDPEKLKGKSLMLATPMYGGNCKGEFARCVMDLVRICTEHGVPFQPVFMYNSSLIGRGRNDLADAFLRSDYTHMLFIDSDLTFSPYDVLACLSSDKDLVGGPYPMKTIDWEWVRDFILQFPEVTDRELSILGRHYHFNFLPNQKVGYPKNELLEVYNVSTGFMMITRKVFSDIATAQPHAVYSSNYANEIVNNTVRRVYNYFGSSVEDDTLLSEDYYFCKRWRETGGKIYLAPWMIMRHIGDYTYGGCGVDVSFGAERLIREYRAKKAVEVDVAKENT